LLLQQKIELSLQAQINILTLCQPRTYFAWSYFDRAQYTLTGKRMASWRVIFSVRYRGHYCGDDHLGSVFYRY